ncbi:hypothetical protein HO133_009085 [Letharia lupina]|uniref:Thaumatin-like protein n=1 Tax=Letharia lupina TaxID=560253 RepID=A0A8H6FFR5_9LECA|nr:uncharacterized protein HO133_009085 [Letharia lupina]KAF6226219.1 hypothetical protein HO133_009085 [Letharia lupina]
MHLTNTLVPFLLTLASPALAAEGVISKDGLGTAIGGALDPTVTPAPKPAVGAAPAVAGPLTIAVTNSFGAGLSISFQHDSGSSSAINNPTPGPLGGATTIIYPSGWAGRIAVGKVMSVINSGSKIEGSFSLPTYQPNIDVSYVDGYTIPITCSCGGSVVTGCNHPLFADPITCANEGPGPICYNPLCASDQAEGTAAAPFFEPCRGAAYTYPNDSGCNVDYVSCCVGSTCPAPAKQHGKRSLVGGHRQREAVDAV